MKRQSKAEEALNKQIKNFNDQLQDLCQDQDRLTSRISTITYVIQQLMQETDKLKQARIKASDGQAAKWQADRAL